MRTREVIEQEVDDFTSSDRGDMKIWVELLLDIRELLKEIKKAIKNEV